MNKAIDPKDTIYTPSETATIGIESSKQVSKYSEYGIPMGIEGIDGYFAPVMPGQLATILGQTSHYKSGLMHFMTEQAALHISKQRTRGNKLPAIVFISTEEFIEEQAYAAFARNGTETVRGLSSGNITNLRSLESTAQKVAGIPIYRVGLSFERENIFYEQLYLSNLIRSVDLIAEKRDIRGIFVDYLQALPIDPEVMSAEISSHRRLQVRRDIYRLKQAASFYKVPVWVAVQAKQTLSTTSQIKIPGIYDAEESSSIAQRADRSISVWLPKNNYLPGAQLRLGDRSLTVTEDMLLLKVTKQRGGFPSGRVWICKIDYERGTIRVDDEALTTIPF